MSFYNKAFFYIFLYCFYNVSCNQNTTGTITKIPSQQSTVVEQRKDTLPIVLNKEFQKPKLQSLKEVSDTTFVRLANYSEDFVYDIRYATTNNFLKEKVYNCAECYTRAITAKALINANNEFLKKGVKIKFFDCYRPNSVQHKMWKIVPNPQYVANPYKGSVHNKGGAVDITLVNLEGEELDMGTNFDFFGWKAYHDNYSLPKNVLKNRKLLKETMEKFGFQSVRSEWWHYNLKAAYKYKVDDFKWDCN